MKPSKKNTNKSNNNTSILNWGDREGAITASSLPQGFEELSPDDQKLYIYKQEKAASKGKEFDKTFSHPRLMSEQQTKPVQLDFWSSTEIADTKLLKRAKVLQTNGTLLNAFSFGIDGDLLTLKVIQTLQEMLSEKSELYGKNGIELSGSNTLLPTARTAPKGNDILGIPQGTKYPAISTTPYEFAQNVKGGRKPNKDDITKVRDELDRLDRGKYLFQDGKSKTGIIMSLLDVTDIIDYEGKTRLFIELRPVFAQIVGQKYVRERKDVARYLRRKVRKAMTLLLYQELIIAFSRGDVGEDKPYYTLKENLFARIAKGASYRKHPKRIMQDYEKALEVMKKIKLLQSYRETEPIGTICYFTLNKNFLKEDIELDNE